MYHKFLIALILLTTLCPGVSSAEPAALVGFDLSLAGYRLGMSYAEVADVRPFQYEQAVIKNSENVSAFYFLVEHFYVDGVAMSLRISFKNEKVHKIVARFSPDSFKKVRLRFQQTMGPGEDKSRVFRKYDDEEIQQTIYLWDFPNAEMHLIAVSSNSEFSTISLTDK